MGHRTLTDSKHWDLCCEEGDCFCKPRVGNSSCRRMSPGLLVNSHSAACPATATHPYSPRYRYPPRYRHPLPAPLPPPAPPHRHLPRQPSGPATAAACPATATHPYSPRYRYPPRYPPRHRHPLPSPLPPPAPPPAPPAIQPRYRRRLPRYRHQPHVSFISEGRTLAWLGRGQGKPRRLLRRD